MLSLFARCTQAPKQFLDKEEATEEIDVIVRHGASETKLRLSVNSDAWTIKLALEKKLVPLPAMPSAS